MAPEHRGGMTATPALPTRSAVSAFLILTLLYAGALFLLDERLAFSRIGDIAKALPLLIVCGVAGMLIRFLRWQWLLGRGGKPVNWLRALPAYVAGFAFTATPGKVGELVRARYFGRLGVPHATVVACFVTERAFDLLVIFVVAASIATHVPGFAVAAAFVAFVIASVFVVAHMKAARRWLQAHLRRRGWRLPARLVRTLFGGVEQARTFLSARDVVVAGGLGAAAWACHLGGFALAFLTLGINVQVPLLLAIPAAAMLVGAASMLPGGIGATETAIVVLLTAFGERVDLAALAAITIRLGSIWFSILLGLAAVAWLERRPR